MGAKRHLRREPLEEGRDGLVEGHCSFILARSWSSAYAVGLFPESSVLGEYFRSLGTLRERPNVVFDRLLDGFTHVREPFPRALGDFVFDGNSDVHCQSMCVYARHVNVANRLSSTGQWWPE